ncbi:MAG: MFS transporter permease [Gomphosphaeria aponina SAG 52.96 = DSM 107014]|uniref:MFS transporter permease n=1 Tax=Gomphosphaeria aponina SAG 52.96 = DSM 107014 TaxID=1521640 RepID=A0A941GP39_9CHRO|nr:MFS transporter permease [Gomphosphaeria aponina SAG 52.96 = DSM 107014]
MPQTLLVGRSEVEAWLNRWTEINGNINKILPSPRSENRGNGEINAEITAYSFDRVVVTDSAAIAQFLIANNFHFENNCAVLSITGYPENIFNTVLEMLRRNPELKVYAIHDASPRGVALVNYLRTNPNWFSASTATIYDLGLIPRQVIKNPKLFMGNSQESAQEGRRLGPEIRSSLSAEEVTWLESGNFVELESFSPRKLLQIITQGIALSRSSIDSEAVTNLNYDDGDTYSSVGIFLVDSFG